jgi:hypothetical protein
VEVVGIAVEVEFNPWRRMSNALAAVRNVLEKSNMAGMTMPQNPKNITMRVNKAPSSESMRMTMPVFYSSPAL